ncbi:MAG: DUF6728 family protein [Bacteroidia bacterium]
MILQKIWSYITFKKNKGEKNSLNLRMMHGINRISLIMFMVAIVVMIIRFCR